MSRFAGDKHDEYGKVASQASGNRNLLIAEIGIQDYGDRENTDLAERYKVKKDDYPVVKLFLNGDLDNPVNFDGKDFKADAIKHFIREHSGLRLVLDQCLQEFDEIVEKFLESSSSKEAQQQIFDDAKAKAETLLQGDKKSADIYIKLMQKVLERGNNFIEVCCSISS